jgi:hypothetical protein
MQKNIKQKKRNSVSDTSTERNSSQFKYIEAAVIEDINKLKEKYRVKRDVKRSKIQKSIKN